jgi:hypothetical protein
MKKIRNPNLEIRNKHKSQISNSRGAGPEFIDIWELEIWNFQRDPRSAAASALPPKRKAPEGAFPVFSADRMC